MNALARKSPAGWPLLWLAVLLCGLLALPGCSGCNGGGATAAAKKKDDKAKNVDEAEELIKKRTKKLEKPKEDFEPLAVRMLPSNDPSPSLKQPPVLVKPGHWISVSEETKTNNFDFAGELTTFCEQQATNVPLEVTDTTSRLWNWRPAILPKGQTKRFECLFFVPRREKHLGGVYSVRSELHSPRGGRTEAFTTTVSPSLKHYEHLIVVLAAGSVSPNSYSHFDRLLSVRMPQIEASKGEPLRYYYVFRPTVARTAPLPSHSLSWTTIAYVFWDDLDPSVLTAQQQQALVDWLHWGGQLIISGPSSLDKLKGSFLAEYLPGEATDAIKLYQADLAQLNARFSLERDPLRVAQMAEPVKPEVRRIVISDEQPLIGVDLKLHPAAKAMDGTGGLVVERRVGGGRIVVTRFPLTDVRIKQWKNFDGFFNSVLLRRPGRVFSEDDSALEFSWDDPNLAVMLEEARLGSTLRYFTRDIGWGGEEWQKEAPPNEEPANVAAARRPQPSNRTIVPAPVYGAPGWPGSLGFGAVDGKKVRPDTSRIHPAIDDFHFAGYGASWPPDKVFTKEKEMDPYGVSAWNDDAAASQAARLSLTEAAGIEIPSADFVIKVLGLYLLVLVPLNWGVFWLLGKVEWAWIAAPLIALVGAGAVIRLAQLDIGFARSRTEVAVLEVQGGYERAHLTRYTALYSSLSSSYTLTFAEPTALAAPFPAGQRDDSLLSIQNYSDVSFRRDKDTSLSGVQVSSNSTGMVHSEQMLPLGTSDRTLETLRLVGDDDKGFSVSNTTDLVLRDIGVFRRAKQSGATAREFKVEAAYVPQLDAASSAVLKFTTLIEPRQASLLTAEGEEQRDRQTGRRRYRPPLVWLEAWNKVPIFAPEATPESDNAAAQPAERTRIRLHRLARLASDQLRLLPGDVRLIGWTDQPLPGMHIRPAAPQNRSYTLVIAHLARGHLPPARPDQNVADDYMEAAILDESEAVPPAELQGRGNSGTDRQLTIDN